MTSSSGMLGVNEVESLASQLASQVSYSNELLMQLQQLEHTQLQTQKDVREKQMALRQAMAVCDSIRQDQVELKKKLELAQQVAEQATDEAKKARVEAQVKSQEADALHRYSEECNEQIGDLRQAVQGLEKQIETLELDKQSLTKNLDEFSRHESSRIAKERENFESVSKELSLSRAKQRPLEQELERTKRDLQDAMHKITERNAADRSLQQELESSGNQRRRLEENLKQQEAQVEALKLEMERLRKTSERSGSEIAALEKVVEARQLDVEKAQQSYDQLQQVNNALKQEIDTLNKELQTVGTDLMKQAEARGAEKQKYDRRIAELQQDLVKVSEAARKREIEATAEAYNRVEEFSNDRRLGQEQYNKLQNEYRQLHDLVQKLQRENALYVDKIEQVRAENEAKVAQANERVRSAEIKLTAQDSESKRECANLIAEVQRLQNEVVSRTSAHVQATGVFQGVVQQLFSECQDLEAQHNGVIEELANLRAEQQSWGAVDGLLGELQSTSRSSVLGLLESRTALRGEAENLEEKLLAMQIQRDEEHAKSLLLEEDLGQVRGEVKALQEQIKTLETNHGERLKQSNLDRESANSLRGELSKRLEETLRQLEESNAQNRILQEENQRATSTLADYQTRMTQRIEGFEKQFEESETKLRSAIVDRDSMAADRELMKKTIQDLSTKIESLQSQIGYLEDSRKDSSDRIRQSHATSEAQLAAVRETLRKYQAQLTQTKNLLKVVQDQRKHLQEDNLSLRAELDEVLRRSLNAAAQEPWRVQGQAELPSEPASVPPHSPGHFRKDDTSMSRSQESLAPPSSARKIHSTTTHQSYVHHHRSSITSSISGSSGFSTTVSQDRDSQSRGGLSSGQTSQSQPAEEKSHASSMPGLGEEQEENPVQVEVDEVEQELELLKREVEALKSSP